ncbi:hypothetical protein UA45_20830, partial [Morganella morganii]
MTLNRLCSGFLFCCALLFTFPALSAAAAPETASQVFIYGQLPPPEAIHRVVSSGPPLILLTHLMLCANVPLYN